MSTNVKFKKYLKLFKKRRVRKLLLITQNSRSDLNNNQKFYSGLSNKALIKSTTVTLNKKKLLKINTKTRNKLKKMQIFFNYLYELLDILIILINHRSIINWHILLFSLSN